jgi:hypothetical protein
MGFFPFCKDNNDLHGGYNVEPNCSNEKDPQSRNRTKNNRGQTTIKRNGKKTPNKKNAPDWLTRPVFGCLSIIVSRSTIALNPWPAGVLERSARRIRADP